MTLENLDRALQGELENLSNVPFFRWKTGNIFSVKQNPSLAGGEQP